MFTYLHPRSFEVRSNMAANLKWRRQSLDLSRADIARAAGYLDANRVPRELRILEIESASDDAPVRIQRRRFERIRKALKIPTYLVDAFFWPPLSCRAQFDEDPLASARAQHRAGHQVIGAR
ncbi:hypothetical protein HQ520_05465 [bacterium]|nr:hypothetical protein [bacterium]